MNWREMQEVLKWPVLLVFGGCVFVLSYHYNKRLLDWLRFQSLGTRDYIVDKLSLMFIDIAPEKILLGQLLLSFGLGIVIFLACLPFFAAGFVFGFFGVAI